MSFDSILQTLVDTAPVSIAYFIIVFNFIGHFGNINVIIVTIKRSELRTKHGVLLAVVCAEHSACLLGEMINAYLTLTASGSHVPRDLCLKLMTPNIFLNCSQAMMFMCILIDVLLLITYPVEHQKWKISIYCCFLCSITTIFPTILLIYAYQHVSTETTLMCNPPIALGEKVTQVWGGSIIIMSFITLTVYFYIYYVVYLKKKDNAAYQLNENIKTLEKKVLKSLSYLVAVFCSSWVLCMGAVYVMKFFTSNRQILIVAQSYMVVLALIAFSQTFYVCWVRSTLYRREFKSLFFKRPPRNAFKLLSVLLFLILKISCTTSQRNLENDSTIENSTIEIGTKKEFFTIHNEVSPNWLLMYSSLLVQIVFVYCIRLCFINLVSNKNARFSADNGFCSALDVFIWRATGSQLYHAVKYEFDRLKQSPLEEELLFNPRYMHHRSNHVELFKRNRLILNNNQFYHASKCGPHVGLMKDHLIAAQSPTEENLDVFLSILVDEAISIVIELHDDQEPILDYLSEKIKVVNYEITCTEVIVDDSMVYIRKAEILNKVTSRKVEIRHFLVKDCPEGGVPPNPEIIKILFKDKLINKRILVHCTEGTGRTMTFMSILSFAFKIEDESENNEILIANIVENMREYRIGAVETYIQYAFIWVAILQLLVIKNRAHEYDFQKYLNAYRNDESKLKKASKRQDRFSQIVPGKIEERREYLNMERKRAEMTERRQSPFFWSKRDNEQYLSKEDAKKKIAEKKLAEKPEVKAMVEPVKKPTVKSVAKPAKKQ